jgi:hypothetical protein
MVRWIGKDSEWSGRDLIKVRSPNFLGGDKENHKNISVRIVDASSEIRTEHHLNINLERYSYANPPGHNLQVLSTSTDN